MYFPYRIEDYNMPFEAMEKLNIGECLDSFEISDIF